MKIPFTHPTKKLCKIFCPSCHNRHCWRHGSYTRKWFHFKHLTRKVWRYYCTCSSCPRRTFTVQAVDALPYCRFLINDVLKVNELLSSTTNRKYAAKVAALDRGVIHRVTVRLEESKRYLQNLYQEVTGEAPVGKLPECLESVLKHYCDNTLKTMWYRSIYRIAI